MLFRSEPLTVDAAKEKGTVCMKPKAYTLPEVAVGKAHPLHRMRLGEWHKWRLHLLQVAL